MYQKVSKSDVACIKALYQIGKLPPGGKGGQRPPYFETHSHQTTNSQHTTHSDQTINSHQIPKDLKRRGAEGPPSFKPTPTKQSTPTRPPTPTRPSTPIRFKGIYKEGGPKAVTSFVCHSRSGASSYNRLLTLDHSDVGRCALEIGTNPTNMRKTRKKAQVPKCQRRKVAVSHRHSPRSV